MHERIENISILNFWRHYRLPQEVQFYFNATDNNESGISPVIEGHTRYNYYIPLEKPIKGYSRILVSASSSDYIQEKFLAGNFDAINDLRVKFMPWPLIILPAEHRRKSGYYNEVDSIVDVLTTCSIEGGYIYDSYAPDYKKLIFKGLKPVYQYKEEFITDHYNRRDNTCNTFEDFYDPFFDSYIEEDKIRDSLESGEDVIDPFC